MKLKLLLGILFVAGIAAALAVAAPTRADDGGAATTTVGTTTGDHHKGKDDEHKQGDKPKCQKVSLKGANGSGSIALTVSRANRGGSSLVGKQVTLTIPAGATVSANACLDASGALTLRELHVDVKHATTTTATTTTTTTTP